MVLHDKKTLVVRHLPSELSKEERIDLLKFFGAIEVNCHSSKANNYNTVFAKFHSENEAVAALQKLHQTEILDQLISVEFARGSDLQRNLSKVIDRQNDVKEEHSTQKKYLDNFLQKINSWTSHLDFHQPPPMYFKYQYPPPALRVLTNIAKVLASVPKFYTQVLHLMNKMNLPCPFSDNFDVESDVIIDNFNDGLLTREEIRKGSEEESEIESEEEKKIERVIPKKRKLKTINTSVKKQKLLKPITHNPSNKQKFKTEDVFDTGQIELPKKIELKVSGDLKRLEEEKEIVVEEGFEKVFPLEPKDENKNSVTIPEVERIITGEELAVNRISVKDQDMLPVFKNYHMGVPSCRLYIKNLAKTVTVSDLNFVFKRYLLPIAEEQGSMFDVHLLQEGRMKGQAFVSLQNIDQAKLALSETNGFILKGKPMVVQYARSSKAK